MTNFTRNAIKASFWKLLSEKSYAKITVKDVAAACGINRNTFYYHFANIPALADACIRDRLFDIVRRNVDESFEKCLTGIFRDLLENKGQILNIYCSTERIRLEQFILTMAAFATERYAEHIMPDSAPEDRKYHTDYVRNAMFGIFVMWLNRGMRDNYENVVRQFCLITNELLDHCRKAGDCTTDEAPACKAARVS